MNKKDLEKKYYDLFSKSHAMYPEYSAPINGQNEYKETKNFIFDIAIHEALRSVLPKYDNSAEDVNDNSLASWRDYGQNNAILQIKQKAKELWEVEL